MDIFPNRVHFFKKLYNDYLGFKKYFHISSNNIYAKIIPYIFLALCDVKLKQRVNNKKKK